MQMAFDFTPDARVLAVALAVTLAAGVLAGLAPALRAGRQDVAEVLKGSGGIARRGARMRSAFVVAQVAGSVVLLIVGAVLLRALARADSVDFGFDPRNVHVLTVDLSLQRYADAQAAAFFQELEARSAALPGVSSAALTTVLPMGFEHAFTVVRVPGEAEYRQTGFGAVSHGYFETMRIGIVAGRSFGPGDRPGALPAVIVNQEAARRFWPGQDALGRQLEGRNRTYTVVGVVRNVSGSSLGVSASPMVYFSFLQSGGTSATLVVRTAPGAARIDGPVRAVALALDPDLPVVTNAPYEQVIGVSLLPNRVAAAVAGAMGLLGLVVAAVGLFGLLSYVVSLRAREMGIRMALGASPRAIRLLVLRQGVRLIALGLLIGGPLALGAAFLMRGMLYGLSPADPLTFAVVTVLLFAVGASASFVPALRATAAEPASVLRAE
jgi:predicted permease